MEDFLPLCEAAARLGGAELRRLAGNFRWREKGKKDLVTEADLASQQAIRDLLLRETPNFDFLGEEDADAIAAAAQAGNRGKRWLVDPLDGTANYVHGLGNYAVSIALEEAGLMLCGVVYDPLADDCFTAARGRGARHNGESIRVSGCARLDQAMIAASFAPHVERGSQEITRFIEVLLRAQTIRRLGSAALNLCYVAAGRLDGYWATSVKVWDIAAGMLILQEAGGAMTGLDGGPVDLTAPLFAASASPALHAELLAALATPPPGPGEVS